MSDQASTRPAQGASWRTQLARGGHVELDAIEAIERAAKALDAVGEAVGGGLADKPHLADMLAMWTMEEAAALRSVLDEPTP